MYFISFYNNFGLVTVSVCISVLWASMCVGLRLHVSVSLLGVVHVCASYFLCVSRGCPTSCSNSTEPVTTDSCTVCVKLILHTALFPPFAHCVFVILYQSSDSWCVCECVCVCVTWPCQEETVRGFPHHPHINVTWHALGSTAFLKTELHLGLWLMQKTLLKWSRCSDYF